MLCRLVLAAVKVRRVAVSCCVVCEIFWCWFPVDWVFILSRVVVVGVAARNALSCCVEMFSTCHPFVVLLRVWNENTPRKHCAKTHRKNTTEKCNARMQRQNATPECNATTLPALHHDRPANFPLFCRGPDLVTLARTDGQTVDFKEGSRNQVQSRISREKQRTTFCVERDAFVGTTYKVRSVAGTLFFFPSLCCGSGMDVAL